MRRRPGEADVRATKPSRSSDGPRFVTDPLMAGRFYLTRFAARPEVGPYPNMQGETFSDSLR